MGAPGKAMIVTGRLQESPSSHRTRHDIMQRTGTILRFDAERGFGFLRCPQSAADVFFHVRDMDCRSGPPVVGMQVDFEEIHVGGKGPRAMAVRPGGQPAARSGPARLTARPDATRRARSEGMRDAASGRSDGPSSSLAMFWLALAVEAGVLGWCIAQGRLPLAALLVGLLLNLATFWLYWHDKDAAQRQTWRVREDTLHVMALVGGWPAAWWAQQLLRHKSRKPSFRSMYAATVVAHLLLLAVWAGLPALR